jgi:hypothetical protein
VTTAKCDNSENTGYADLDSGHRFPSSAVGNNGKYPCGILGIPIDAVPPFYYYTFILEVVIVECFYYYTFLGLLERV